MHSRERWGWRLCTTARELQSPKSNVAHDEMDIVVSTKRGHGNVQGVGVDLNRED